MRKIVFAACALLALLFILGAADGFGGKKQQSPFYTQGKVNPARLHPVTDSRNVKVGDVVWNLLEAKDLGNVLGTGTNQYARGTVQTEGKFIGLRFSVENQGSQIRYIYDLRLIDGKGNVYPICLAAYAAFFPQEACALQEIIPDVKMSFSAAYEVPLKANDFLLEVTDLNTPPEKKEYLKIGL
jgi:hypothetical protein